jgi:hypothetical protein
MVLLSLLARVEEILQAGRRALQEVVPFRQLFDLLVDLDKHWVAKEVIPDQRPPFVVIGVRLDACALRSPTRAGTL